MDSPSLIGLNILLIRPKDQALQWQNELMKHGAHVFICASLDIQPVTAEQQKQLRQTLNQIAKKDILIFTSPNAVKYGLALFPPNLPAVKFIAIGPGTAQELQRAKVEVDFVPAQHTSEGLLSSPLFQKVANKRIFIISGEGGREKLTETLKARLAQVTKLAVYQRQKPKANLAEDVIFWQKAGANLLLATTLEGLQNLKSLIPSHHWEWITSLPLMVLSNRLAEGAKNLGFKSELIISSNSSISTILEELSTWYNKKIKQAGPSHG